MRSVTLVIWVANPSQYMEMRVAQHNRATLKPARIRRRPRIPVRGLWAMGWDSHQLSALASPFLWQAAWWVFWAMGWDSHQLSALASPFLWQAAWWVFWAM